MTAATAGAAARSSARPDAVLLHGTAARWTGVQRLRDVAQGILLFKLLIGAFTAIALLVGGIGIMNGRLASVLERTREIRVRRAVAFLAPRLPRVDAIRAE